MSGKYTTLDRDLQPAFEARDTERYVATVRVRKSITSRVRVGV
jgi:hypothetical protein